ncbi:MAG: GTP-binding protein, partial [Alphaproteobacteria bacterium]|nr:GTP-binding protein [Alphaproteobacteria bacterium]
MAEDERIPVSLLTGFLGSGKTTLLGRALTHPALGRVAVIINEFGDVGLDHDLLEASSEDMVMLGNGCLCCSIHGSLVETMRDLLARREAGRVAFERVIIETSGLADPVPVLRMIESDAVIAARYRIETVIATVDAVSGARALDAHGEAVRQAAVADTLLVTKSDIAPPAATATLKQRLASLNPTADLHTVVQGDIAPEAIFFRGLSVKAARHELPACDHEHGHTL